MDPARRGLLPVPRLADGAVGRPGLRRLHRRHRDRRGARPQRPAPGRWWLTNDDLVVLACEAGVLDLDPATVVAQGPAAAGPDVPGRHRGTGRIVDDDEIKGELAAEHPYADWLHAGLIAPRRPARRASTSRTRHESVVRRQQTFGYTEEELRILLTPMAAHRRRADRLDGHRHPDRGAVERPRLLFDYFSQLFAQVTNPPLDAIREELVTSLRRSDRPGAEPARRRARVVPAGRAAVPGPRQRRARQARPHQRRRRPARLRAVPSSPASTTSTGGGEALRGRLERDLPRGRPRRSSDGARIIVLSDRDSDRRPRADPVAAAHRRGAPPPGPREDPHPGRPGRRVRRRPRGAPRRAAARLRRRARSTRTWPSRPSRT